jgi:hypothetical protein
MKKSYLLLFVGLILLSCSHPASAFSPAAQRQFESGFQIGATNTVLNTPIPIVQNITYLVVTPTPVATGIVYNLTGLLTCALTLITPLPNAASGLGATQEFRDETVIGNQVSFRVKYTYIRTNVWGDISEVNANYMTVNSLVIPCLNASITYTITLHACRINSSSPPVLLDELTIAHPLTITYAFSARVFVNQTAATSSSNPFLPRSIAGMDYGLVVGVVCVSSFIMIKKMR